MNSLCIYTNTCFDKTPVNLGPDGVPNDSWATGASSSTWVSSSLPRKKNGYIHKLGVLYTACDPQPKGGGGWNKKYAGVENLVY